MSENLVYCQVLHVMPVDWALNQIQWKRILHSISKLQVSVPSLISLVQSYRKFKTIQTYMKKKISLCEILRLLRNSQHPLKEHSLKPSFKFLLLHFLFFIQIVITPWLGPHVELIQPLGLPLQWSLHSGLSISLKSLLSFLSIVLNSLA